MEFTRVFKYYTPKGLIEIYMAEGSKINYDVISGKDGYKVSGQVTTAKDISNMKLSDIDEIAISIMNKI